MWGEKINDDTTTGKRLRVLRDRFVTRSQIVTSEYESEMPSFSSIFDFVFLGAPYCEREIE